MGIMITDSSRNVIILCTFMCVFFLTSTNSEESKLDPSLPSSSSLSSSSLDSLKSLNSIPKDWNERIRMGQMVYSPDIPKDENLLPSLGNGYLGTVMYSDSIFSAGIYVGTGWFGTSHSKRAQIPSTISVFLTFQNQTSSQINDAMQSHYHHYHHEINVLGGALDFEKATYFNRTLLQHGDVSVEQRWYIHREIRSLTVYEISIDNSHSDSNLIINLHNPTMKHGFSSKDINFKKSSLSSPSSSSSSSSSWKSNDQFVAYHGRIVQGETSDSDLIEVAVVMSMGMDQMEQEIVVAAKTKYTATFLTTVRGELDSPKGKVLEAAIEDFALASKYSSDELYDRHVREWSKLWYEGGGIEIGGRNDSLNGVDPLAAKVNSSMYAILLSVRDDWPWAASPASLSTTCYNGQIFWDLETWILPNLMYFHPSIAKMSFEYRLKRLEQAKQHAKKHGYHGAMYPWQSGFSGHDVSMFPIFNILEQHVSGDISFGVQQFWRLLNDKSWLDKTARPIVDGIAKFWESKVEKETLNSTSWKYSIHHVVPPDEFAIGFPLYEGVSNNPFTNIVALKAMQFSCEVKQILENRTSACQYQDIIDNMVVLFDNQHEIHPEYEGFPKGNIYFLEKVKQADVLLIYFPLEFYMPEKSQVYQKYLRNDIVYYEPKMDENGPAMTDSIHTIAYLMLKNESMANSRFEKSMLNIQKPFHVWTETPDPKVHPMDLGCYHFITGAGGFLQSIIHGYIGMRIRNDHLLFLPHVTFPNQNIEFIRLRSLKYRGFSFDVTVDKVNIQFNLKESPGVSSSSSERNLCVVDISTGKKYTMSPSVSLKHALIAVLNC